MGTVSYELLINLALEQEHPDAMWRVAVRYKHGAGVERDMNKARQLLVKAAGAGHTFAMWQLANAFNGGKWGLAANNTKAGYWYLRLFKQWLIQAARGDGLARYFVEMYRLEQIESPTLRKSLGLPQLQQ